MKKGYVQIDKYMYDASRPIGEGSCGKVYLGFYAKGHENQQTFLAIKEIPVKASTDITDSLLSEINVLRRVAHPNIVGFIDAKKNEEYMYLVTQFCNQGTVEDLILEHSLSETDVIHYMRQIAKAFRYLVSRQVLHRDIKPQNLLLHNNVIKVADFGLAKMADEKLKSEQFKTFSGTPVFMSPQIIKQEPYTSLTDLWSLGVTFYFMICKQYPWEEVNPMKLLSKIQHKIQNLFPEGLAVSEPVKDLIRRMLIIEESQRIKWADFFKHPVLADEEMEHTLSMQTIVEDLTLNNFVLKEERLSDTEISELQEYGRRQTMNYEAFQDRFKKATRAKEQFDFERSVGMFFLQISKELEAQRRVNTKVVPEAMYYKCLFLLYKRMFCVFYNLNQMLLFDSPSSGLIEINKGDWTEFMTSDFLEKELSEIKVQTQRDYEFAKREFSRVKDLLYEAQYSVENFQLIDRGDAFKDASIEENEYLIMAINDNFKPLFMLIADQLEPIFQNCMENQRQINKQQLLNEYKLDLIFAYDLILFLCLRNVIHSKSDATISINFAKYYEERKRVDEIELLYRIHLQRQAWSE